MGHSTTQPYGLLIQLSVVLADFLYFQRLKIPHPPLPLRQVPCIPIRPALKPAGTIS